MKLTKRAAKKHILCKFIESIYEFDKPKNAKEDFKSKYDKNFIKKLINDSELDVFNDFVWKDAVALTLQKIGFSDEEIFY